MTTQEQASTLNKLRIWLWVIAVEGLISLVWLLSIPSEGGLSLMRMGMAAILLTGMLLPLAGLTPPGLRLLSQQQKSWREDNLRNRRIIFWLLLLAIHGLYLLLLATEAEDIAARATLTRLSPIIFYFTLLCLHGIILFIPALLPALRQSAARPIFVLTIKIFGCFLLGWGLIYLTKWGVTPERVGWNAMGVPLLETYVFLAWLIVVLAGKLFEKWQAKQAQNSRNWQLDAVIILVLYFSAVLLWRSTPAPSNWFVTRPYPPNAQPYPASDALRYDTTAQSILIGEGLKTDDSMRTLRPLYTGFLALLHAATGPDYQPVADLQPFFLALFPILLYFLGCRMHSRMAGVFLALLIIMREQTAIELSNRITISHVKLLMADLPTALALAGFILLTVIWLKERNPRWQMALFSGGALGAAMLIRPESIVMSGAVGLIALLNWRKPLTTGMIQIAIFALGIVLIITPWVYRNWLRYDQIFFDSPTTRVYSALDRALKVPPTLSDPQTMIPTQTAPVPDNPSEEVLDKVIFTVSSSPAATIATIINHYLNSEIQSLLALPATFRLPDSLINFLYHKDTRRFWVSCCQPISYIERLSFWKAWGQLPAQAILLILGNLVFVAAGIAVAFRQLHWVGLFPLLAHVMFLAGIALFRTSGGRFILPVNWIVILYYAIGVVAFTLWAGKALGWVRTLPGWNTQSVGLDSTRNKNQKTGIVEILAPGVCLLVLGAALPFAERAFPPRYSNEFKESLVTALTQSLLPEEQNQMNSLFTTENMITLPGQALYPRFLKAESGERDKDPIAATRPYNRLTFYLIGPRNLRVQIPVDQLETDFPNGSDVLVGGCIYTEDSKEVLDALFLARVDNEGNIQELIWRSENLPFACTPQ